MKVRDVVTNWPIKRWARDDAPQAAFPPTESEDLRLQWFGSPDDEGWFRIIATDSEQHDWSTFCRIEDSARWPALEIALGSRLRASLAEIGMVELEESAENGDQPAH
jgi:hypothetical protein